MGSSTAQRFPALLVLFGNKSDTVFCAVVGFFCQG
jgi:hypothetical protein